MKKVVIGRTRDELIRNWGEKSAPTPTIPSAASSGERKLGPAPVQVSGDPRSRIPSELLPDPDFGGAGPAARSVNAVDPNPDELDPLPIPLPQEWTRESPSKVRRFDEEGSYSQPRRIAGDPMPGIAMEPAPVPGLDRTTEYSEPASRLPMVCTQAESLRRNEARGNTPWTAASEAEAPLLSGTRAAGPSTTPVDRTTGDAFAELRRRGGGF